MKVSVICPIYNEERFIDRCIHSMLRQHFPQNEMEFLLVDGRSTDRTREIVETYVKRYAFIRLLDNPHKAVPYALNIAIREAVGEVIVRIDGHCEYPADYLSVLVGKLYELKADNVGGVWHTMPARDSSECIAIAEASSHRFGVGGSAHKVGATRIERVDTVPFGCYRREVFDRIGLFDEELVRNQDDEFNARLIRNGGTIYLIPEVVIDYTARDSWRKMCRMYYQYGLFKPLVNKKLGRAATVRQFFPALFLCGLVAGGVLSLFSEWVSVLYWTIIAIYFLIGFIVGVRRAIRYGRAALVFYLPLTFFLIHISYGWGYICGIWKILTRRPFSVEVNR